MVAGCGWQAGGLGLTLSFVLSLQSLGVPRGESMKPLMDTRVVSRDLATVFEHLGTRKYASLGGSKGNPEGDGASKSYCLFTSREASSSVRYYVTAKINYPLAA